MSILKDIKSNLYGGVTAGIIALPLALAFGVASGLGASAGLWGAIIVCFFATIFGGTATQISGPTGPMTVIVASLVLAHPNNPKLIFMVLFLAGFFQIAFGLLKIGKFVNYVPYPVISGFMSGIGAIIICLQINSLVGFTFEGSPIDSLFNFFLSLKIFNMANVQSLILGALTLGIVFFTPKKIRKKVPAPLIALVLVTILSIVFHFDVKTIGHIPAAFPSFDFPFAGITALKTALPIALTLALLGSVDSLLTSLVADSLTKTKHDSNKELIGQGLGNIVASMLGGLAGAGATMRTVVNIKSGGNSRISGMVHSLFLVLIVLCFAPAASKIPLAVLAGILIKVGFDIIDYKFLKILKCAPKSDLTVMLFVFLITVLDDLIFAVGVGIVLSSVLFAAKISTQMNIKIKEFVFPPESNDSKGCIEEYCQSNILIMHIKGIFFFGTASEVLARVETLMDAKFVIIDCKPIRFFDISAAFALEDMIVRLQDNGIKPLIVLNNRKIAGQLFRYGLIKFIKKDDIFFDVECAVEKIKIKFLNVN